MGIRSSVKCLGLTAGDSFSPHPLLLLSHPFTTSPPFFVHPRRAPSLARFSLARFSLACSISAWKEKGNGCYAGYSKDKWAVLSDLRSNDSIIIATLDKGSGAVIVSRLDYLNKKKKLISDDTKFKQLNKIQLNLDKRAFLYIFAKSKKTKLLMT